MKHYIRTTWSGKINVSIVDDSFVIGKETLGMSGTAPVLLDIPEHLKGVDPQHLFVVKHLDTGAYEVRHVDTKKVATSF